MHRILTAAIVAALAFPAIAKSSPADPPQAADSLAIYHCLAERKAKSAVAGTRIGKVSDPCMSTPGDGTTYGMMDCSKREIAVWNSKLNAAHQALQNDASPKLTSTLCEA
jgi:hypothetical protein